VVVNSKNQPSAPFNGVSYARPSVSSIVGPCSLLAPYRLAHCPRTTSQARISLNGANFGFSGAEVFIGTESCFDVQHVPGSEHTSLSCLLPSGFASLLPIRVFQFNGASSIDPWTLSYEPCSPGYFLSGFDCVSCQTGTYNSDTGGQCKICPPGSFCPSNGTIAPQACISGSFARQEGQTACELCLAGRFSSANGSLACTDCERGRFSGLNGSSVCNQCNAGRFSPGAESSCTLCSEGTFGRKKTIFVRS
jgi:hypothetical protein